MEKIIKANNPNGLSQLSLHNSFKDWFQMNYGNRKGPKASELYEVINKKFGNRDSKKNKWFNITIKEDDADDDISELNNNNSK
jgi:hypothetical protein